jgi:uncharacterized membrane protein
MANLVVITFDLESEAHDALRAMRRLEKEGVLHLTDTAVVEKDVNGHVHVKNEWSAGTEIGAVAGGFLGLLTSFFFPVVGTVAGAAAGGWIGSTFNTGVDGAFVEDVSRSLRPGRSALFLMIGGADPAALRAALEPYAGQGHVLQTSLSAEMEESLRQALRDRA